MSVRKAQNRVRKKYGIGKTVLHKRMSANRHELEVLAYSAQWPGEWAGTFDEKVKREMHKLVDALAADSIIATAYRKAEIVAIQEGARASGENEGLT